MDNRELTHNLMTALRAFMEAHQMRHAAFRMSDDLTTIELVETIHTATPGVTFQDGDVVVMRCGGPAMTVEQTNPRSKGQMVKCCWFDREGPHREVYQSDQLMLLSR